MPATAEVYQKQVATWRLWIFPHAGSVLLNRRIGDQPPVVLLRF